ncbi:MAG: hypothetical protein SP1CHLAM54_00240 [Chlamydiia bacterium]|nr:hypothetical protein [Chlamydiia bacterium]
MVIVFKRNLDAVFFKKSAEETADFGGASTRVGVVSGVASPVVNGNLVFGLNLGEGAFKPG